MIFSFVLAPLWEEGPNIDFVNYCYGVLESEVQALEPLHGVLGSRENGLQNNQGAGSRAESNLEGREQKNNSREQGAEEYHLGATHFLEGAGGQQK